MRKCQYCNSEMLDEAARFCTSCGRALATPESGAEDQGDDLDFVVSEAPMSDPAFVGSETTKISIDDDLGIEPNSNLMEQEASALSEESDLGKTSNNFMEPIGESEPPLPPPPAPVEPPQTSTPVAPPQAMAPIEPPKPAAPTPPPAEPKKPAGNYLSAEEKEFMLRKLAEEPAPKPAPQPTLAKEPEPEPQVVAEAETDPPVSSAPASAIPEIASDMPAPQISERGRGVAYFYRNYIQLIGSRTIHAGDDLTIGDRMYELKPKKIDSKVLIGSAAGVLALLLFVIIAQFVAVDAGHGRIFGVALDDTGRPYVQGATIRLTELGKSVRTNPQGVFVFEDVPAGTHQLEYRVSGAIIGKDYTTVVGDESSVLVLQPGMETAAETDEADQSQARVNSSSSSNEHAQADNRPSQESDNESGTKPRAARSSSTSTTDRYAKLSLRTNIEGARLKLNGNIIGAGNMTFSKLTPGTYDYVIDAQGYNPATGKITLRAGATEALIVDMKPMTQAQLRSAYSAKDFYAEGMSAAREGDLSQAAADYTEAISKNPSYADAYMARADVESQLGQDREAYADYVSAGDNYVNERNANEAISAYNRAVEIDPKSTDAYLGRGEVYLALNQQIAALADFDMALEIDDGSPRGHFGLGRARFEQGNYKKAAKHFDKARDLDPSNAAAYQYLMLSYAAMDDEKKVMKSFEKFREIATNEQIEELLTSSQFSSISEIIRNN